MKFDSTDIILQGLNQACAIDEFGSIQRFHKGRDRLFLKRFSIDPKRGLPAVVIFDAELQPSDITKNGEMAALARKGEEEVQGWFFSRFPRDAER